MPSHADARVAAADRGVVLCEVSNSPKRHRHTKAPENITQHAEMLVAVVSQPIGLA